MPGSRSPGSRDPLERALALLVRHWAFNMTLIHDRGGTWPGFGYSPAEQTELRAIAKSVPLLEYGLWTGLVAVIFIAIIVGVMFAGMTCLGYALGGAQNLSAAPASILALGLALVMVVSFSIGLPAAMLPASALAGRLFSVADADLPDGVVSAHYIHKLWFQVTRMVLVLLVALIPLWLFVPGDSRFLLIARLVLPLLSPAVAALSSAYYLSARLRKR
jgi:hypothetical protein